MKAGVLVVLDGSETSLRALDVAGERARERGTALGLLAIIPPRLWRAKRGQFQIPQEKHDEAFANEVLTDGKRRCHDKGLQVVATLRSGPLAAVILEEAAKGYELVVLGERPNPIGAPTLASILKDRLTVSLEVVQGP